MLFSKSFIFTTREVSDNIKNKSYRWMIRAGLIQQEANGIFYYLPLMKKIMDKVEAIIDKEMMVWGCCKIICPILQNADRWRQSGRYDAYGPEMLRFNDRHNKELLYSPTAEEGFFYMVKTFVKSYRHLPKYIYQINWKFRDEISPRNGLLRGREFLMKDGYSFHNTLEDSYEGYLTLYNLYVNIFNNLGIGHNCVVAAGDSGPIGGKLNHEIVFLEEEGDTTVWFQNPLENYNSLETLNAKCGAVEDYLKDPTIKYQEAKGIELGHLFNYGDKYSKNMDVVFINNQGEKEYVYGGCYGIGVTRVIAAIVQKYSDENGIIWPESIAPFKFHIVFNENRLYEAMKIYNELDINDVLLDDRDESLGVKMKDADLLGCPYQIILGNKTQVKNRSTGIVEEFENIKTLMDFIKQ